jgi:hypothetical protein
MEAEAGKAQYVITSFIAEKKTCGGDLQHES